MRRRAESATSQTILEMSRRSALPDPYRSMALHDHAGDRAVVSDTTTLTHRASSDTSYPFLTNLAAVRAASAARRALHLDVVSESFDEANASPREESTDAIAVPDSTRVGYANSPDGEDPFQAQLRARVSELGDKALETRELSKHRAGLRDMIDGMPSSIAGRAWVDAFARAIRRVACSVDSVDRDAANDIAGRVLTDYRAVFDKMDQINRESVARLESIVDPIEKKLADNYGWIRKNSTMLGVRCASEARCPVCLTQNVSMFIDPCGHTFCTSCISRCGDDECCICRTAIRVKRKLFWCG